MPQTKTIDEIFEGIREYQRGIRTDRIIGINDKEAKKALADLLLELPILQDEPLPSSLGMQYSNDGSRNENAVVAVNRLRSNIRQAIAEALGVER